MEKEELFEEDKSIIANVTCPNCLSEDMEEITNIFTTMDRLEWHSFITTTISGSWLIVWLVRLALRYFNIEISLPSLLRYGLIGVVIIVVGCISYCIIAELSVERYKNDKICVWYVRCAKCHAKYRVVRPLGATPPWTDLSEDADYDIEEAASLDIDEVIV